MLVPRCTEIVFAEVSDLETVDNCCCMTGKTISGSDVALIREPSSTNGVNLGVNVDNTTSSKPLFDFDRLIGVLTVLVENVSSTETLPTRGPAPEINPTENNALLDSAEKVKTKVESEISPPKV